MITTSGLTFPLNAIRLSTNADEDESAFIAIRLRLTTAANEEQ